MELIYTLMKIIKSFQYYIKTNTTNKKQLENILFGGSFLYNELLKDKIKRDKDKNRQLILSEQSKLLTKLRKENKCLQITNRQILNEVIMRVNKTWNNHFRFRKLGLAKGYPKIKQANRYNSFGNIQTLVIARKNGRWYANFICEVEIQPREMTEKVKNQQKDTFFKMAQEFKKYDGIARENLTIANMIKNRSLMEDTGGQVVKVNPYNTTQRCSNCGAGEGFGLHYYLRQEYEENQRRDEKSDYGGDGGKNQGKTRAEITKLDIINQDLGGSLQLNDFSQLWEFKSGRLDIDNTDLNAGVEYLPNILSGDKRISYNGNGKNKEFTRQIQAAEAFNQTLSDEIRFPKYEQHDGAVYTSRLINTKEITRRLQTYQDSGLIDLELPQELAELNISEEPAQSQIEMPPKK
ncbi:516_t:CDS:2 [Cetraspora pellucida]|uniref:516_t:CDS:1 n=1 Tax=Cetraspora pellucida TaxID=1433469 RepID=A0ACA9LXT2_9GLOM|nr:516_t:CDS:2 [Cetraspora pellucida]